MKILLRRLLAANAWAQRLPSERETPPLVIDALPHKTELGLA